MQDHIILDVEIKTPIDRLPNGWRSTELMGVSCCVLYEVKNDRYRIYDDTDDDLLDLRRRVMTATRITTWNGWAFDFQVIFGKPSSTRMGELSDVNDDLLRRCWLSQGLDPDSYDTNSHGGWSLDTVAKATLRSMGKTGDGSKAPKYYLNGQWGKLIDYCLNDVKLTKELCEFTDKYGYLHGKDGMIANIGKNWYDKRK